MSTIKYLSQQAQLAEAAYSNFANQNITKYSALLENDMAPTQATDLLAHWDVVDHVPDLNSGFSATIFRSRTDPGHYTLAVRGSREPLQDFVMADATLIAKDGVAVLQLVDLYNFWQRAMTPVGQSYSAARLVASDGTTPPIHVTGLPVDLKIEFINSSQLANPELRAGSGSIGTLLTDLDVTGHSLGGHLAMAFTRLFPALGAQALAVNGLGFKIGDGNVDNLFAALGGGNGFNAGLIENIYGDAGPEFAAMDSLALQQPGGYDGIFIESGGLDTWLGHSGMQMTDSMAVYAAYAQLDPALTVSAITSILNASANRNADSLETALDNLREVILGPYAEGTVPNSRESLHAHLQELQTALAEQPARTIVPLTSLTRDQIASLAKTEIAYRYALEHLNPFTVTGDDALYAQHNEDGHLDAGRCSDLYLQDRAALLAWKMNFDMGNLDDDDALMRAEGTEKPYDSEWDTWSVQGDWRFTDHGTQVDGQPLSIHVNNVELWDSPDHHIVFGAGQDDALTGAGLSDHLYGNAGADTLTGGQGADYLEGGAGEDTYVYASGDGLDTILDSDGLGRLEWDGQAVKGKGELQSEDWKETGPGLWQDMRAGYTYLFIPGEAGGTLKITRGDDSLTIRNWAPGQLGILLGAGQAPGYNEISGTEQADTLSGTSGNDRILGLGGNDSLNATQGGDDRLEGGSGNDSLAGGSGADRLIGGEGDDGIVGGAGNDWLEGGPGQDTLDPGAGHDVVLGGAGREIINGGAGNDFISGGDLTDIQAAIRRGDSAQGTGEKGDWLVGGLGEDVVIGGDDNDVLFGGGGSDVIVGGAGDDVINAGDDYTASSFDWSVTEYGNPFDRKWSPVVIANPDSDGGGHDEVYGGNGNDLLLGLRGDDYLDGGAGHDTLAGNDGDDELFGGAGDDRMTGDYGQLAYDSGSGAVMQGNDTLDGEDGNDWQQGEAGADVLFGGAGNDTLLGDADYLEGARHGADYLDGEAGDDTLHGQGGDDILHGGDGNDRLQGDASDLAVEYQGRDTLDGGAGDDTLLGQGGGDTLYGGEGADTMNGDDDFLDVALHGADVMHGGAGDDILAGGGGDDVMSGDDGDDVMVGDSAAGLACTGDDVLDGGAGMDYLDGGPGNDTLRGGTEADSLYGREGDDRLDGEDGNDQAQGGLGDDALEGGSGDDILLGGDGNDSLSGGAGVDHLQGDSGDDILAGGEGDDALLGLDGNDSLSGGAGHDELQGGAGRDTLHGDDGDDTLFGQGDNDTLDGGAGHDNLVGDVGDDFLAGGDDGDTLWGQDGADVLEGGAGEDILYGNAGDDIYRFELGDGSDVIWEEGDSAGDVLRFGAGIAAADIRVSKIGADLVLRHVNGVDRVTVANWYVNETYRLAAVEFADGTVWNGSGLGDLGWLDVRGTAGGDALYGDERNQTLAGLEGNDTLYGNGGDDTLSGGTGDDSVAGGAGADTYLFALGDGADVIDGEYIDTLRFAADIARADMDVERVGSDMVLRHRNGTDSVRIANWYGTGTYDFLQQIVYDADGTTVSAYTLGQMGVNHVNGYTFDVGAGAVVIDDWGGADSLTFGAGIADADIVIAAQGQDLRLSHLNGIDSVTIRGWFDDVTKQIETIQFSVSGNTLTTAQLTTPFLTLTGTAGNDVLQGGNAYGETLYGLGGNDTLLGGGGNDTLVGGTGNDMLQGGDGMDTYTFNAGDGQDTITGAGLWDWDTLVFGSGLLGQLAVSGGNGQDTLYAFGADSVRVKAGSNVTPKFIADGTAAAETLNGSVYGDVVHGLAGNDALNGNEGADELYGDAGNDTLQGGPGSDRLHGGEGDDILDGALLVGVSDQETFGSDSIDYYVGGKGNDTLNGNSHSDYYRFDLGDGHDIINEAGFFGNGHWIYSQSDELSFGAGIVPEDLRVSKRDSDLVIQVADTDSITIKGWFSDYKYWVDSFRFADGQVMSGSAMTQLALTIRGTPGDDVLDSDSSWGNTLYGEAGNDILNGAGGPDALHGGTGSDVLNGGAGNDRYFFERGAGQDVIDDWWGQDTVRFDDSISATDLSLSRSGDDLVLALSGADDALTIKGYFNGGYDVSHDPDSNALTYQRLDPIESFLFGDGSTLPSRESLFSRFLDMPGSDTDDQLTGTDHADVLYGYAGDDTLRGAAGEDVLYGGAGNDHLDGGEGAINLVYGESGNDRLTATGGAAGWISGTHHYLHGGEGDDSYVIAAKSYAHLIDTQGDDKIVFLDGVRPTDLSFQPSSDNGLNISTGHGGEIYIYNQFFRDADKIERMTFADGTSLGLRDIQFGTGAALMGSAEDSILIGSVDKDSLSGGDGNDWLDGGAGADAMQGGMGDDLYFVADRGDTVTESVGQGTDTVVSTLAHTLGANVERLILAGTAGINGTGNALDNRLTGNGAGNTLTGGAGNDTLDGQGGTDKMVGGTGDDIYVVDASAETVTERSNEGTDSVLASVSFVLPANVEKLTLTGTANSNATGNSLNNALVGNGAANILSGGAGADTMAGGAGDDTYEIDNPLDSVSENPDEGIDSVQASVTATLADHVENLMLTGKKAINGTGNALANYLRGNGAANTLNGGAGDDLLEGGAGNDSLADVSGKAYMYGGDGTDTLTGGSANELFIGGAGSDTITTGDGADLILFNRGDGADTIHGGIGTDNTLSLGGGIRYADLSFAKLSNDLVLNVGNGETLTFKNWYVTSANNQSTATLQVIVEAASDYAPGGSDVYRDHKIEQFDFAGLVAQFDAARGANPGLSSWALSNALTGFHLGGSDTAALGGDLAYWYGRNGNLAGMNVGAAREVVGDPGFGATNQTLRTFSGISGGVATLA